MQQNIRSLQQCPFVVIYTNIIMRYLDQTPQYPTCRCFCHFLGFAGLFRYLWLQITNLINCARRFDNYSLSHTSYHSWLARTDPADVARVESRTFICSEHERDVVPAARAGQKSALGNYISPKLYDKAISERFPGCMRGKVNSEFLLRSAKIFLFV